ncbi:Major facilitator super domain-containing protein 3 [Cyanidiococcus yangmingshanensis]|uniref:Major facilitator super domain-containing protein 3 n=1 Tax=Cyanidiococcus yangmingshanensis TaxID=2690220 RepID=A0A7J7IK14_9RHOD|nr:Major facilitator super domain-containing protein 3 [Cyanidiococcus yangmingshanensis]
MAANRRRGASKKRDLVDCLENDEQTSNKPLVPDSRAKVRRRFRLRPWSLTDWRSGLYARVLLLIVLYLLQGVPMGLTFGSLPFLLQTRSSYAKLGVFSSASYPYSLKLLWSPVVDAVYVARIGRRKSWIVPVQLIIGLTMVFLAGSVEQWVDSARVIPITLFCFGLVFLAATQDIAVDGWALTLLGDAQSGYASTCQSLGLSLGYFSSFTVFLALNNAEFCSRWLHQPAAVVSLASFLRIMGSSFLAFTFILAFFVKENDITNQRANPGDRERAPTTVVAAYRALWCIVKKRPIQRLVLFLVLSKFPFSAHDHISSLQLVRRGFPRQQLAFMAVLQWPFDMIGAIVAGRYARSSRSLRDSLWQLGFFLRLLLAIFTPMFIHLMFPYGNGALPAWLFVLVFIISVLYQLASDGLMFVSTSSFCARISDKHFGGTYLTLLNTASNLGGTWATPLVFAAAHRFGYIGVALCLPLVGLIVFFMLLRPTLIYLERVPASEWLLATEQIPSKE